MSEPQPHPGARAHVRVLHGAPDDDELAALVAGLVAASSQADRDADDDRERHVSATAWSDRTRDLRGRGLAHAPGPDSWRWSMRG